MRSRLPSGRRGARWVLEVEASVNADLAQIVTDVDEAARRPLIVEVITAFADEHDLVLEARDLGRCHLDAAFELHFLRDACTDAAAEEEPEVVIVAEAAIVDVVANETAACDEIEVLVDRPMAAAADQPAREVDVHVIEADVLDLDQCEEVLGHGERAAQLKA